MSSKNKRPKPGQPSVAPNAKNYEPKPTDAKVSVSFEDYPGNRFCLSKHSEEEIQSFLDCLKKLTSRTWVQLYQSSSKVPARKSGLNATTYKMKDLRNPDLWPSSLGEDINFVGVRASERRGIYGVRRQNIFYVLWFDEAHSLIEG